MLLRTFILLSLIHKVAYSKEIEVSFEGLHLKRIESFKKPWIQLNVSSEDRKLGVLSTPGLPEVPALRFTVQGKVEQIRVRASNKFSRRSLEGEPPVVPAECPHPIIPEHQPTLCQNHGAYKAKSNYPIQRFQLRQLGSLHGIPQVEVTLFPLQLSEGWTQVHFTQDFQVTVPEQVRLVRPKTPTIAFVVPKDFIDSPSVKNYRLFHEGMGHSVTIVSIEPATSFDGIFAKLRGTYKKFTTQLTDVLLFGDHDRIPGHITPQGDVTDHYFGCLDTDDYLSDLGAMEVAVGRFSFTKESELSAIINKSIAYSTLKTTEAWLSRVSTIATNDQKYAERAEKIFDQIQGSFLSAQGYHGNFPMMNQPGADQLYAIKHGATTPDLATSFDEGRHLIFYFGHGVARGWYGPKYFNSHVDSLRPSGAIPIVMGYACDTANFVGDSLAEHWQRNPYGSVAYWGFTHYSYWNHFSLIANAMLTKMFSSPTPSLGEIFTTVGQSVQSHYGKDYWATKYYWRRPTVFGDPSIIFNANRNGSRHLLVAKGD